MSSRTTLTFVGDIMLDRRVSNKIKKFGYRYPFLEVVSLLKKSDITFGNLEAPFSKRGSPIADKRIAFEAIPEAAKGLTYAGIDIVSLANNHVLDYGEEALADTLAILEKAKIKYVGLYYRYRTWRGMPTPRFEVIRKNGVRFGFLAYATLVPGNFLPTPKRPGVMSVGFFKKSVRDDVRELRKHADVVIISLHMGKEYSRSVTARQQAYAYKAVDAGADLVIGHGPHVLHKIEKYKQGLIFYSLGNFVFDQEKNVAPSIQKSIIVQVMFTDADIKSYKIIPTVITRCQPRLLDWEIKHVF